jgi:hypothetical protein
MNDWLDELRLLIHGDEAAARRMHWVPPPPPYDPSTPIVLPDQATLRRVLDGLNQL